MARPKRTCTIDGCGKPQLARGWCSAHWCRWRKYGDPLGSAAPRPSVIERICASSRREDRGYLTPCRVWAASLFKSGGYGAIRISGESRRTARVHVEVYEHVYGPVIPGNQVHHRCEQPDCHEPLHLIDLAPKEHAAEHAPTHCIRGHEFTEENTYYRLDRPGNRHCKACHREYEKRRRDERA